MMNKPHIEYNDLEGHWICHSEEDSWRICIGAGETPLMAYRSWESKVPRAVIETPKHWNETCQDGGKWRLT